MIQKILVLCTGNSCRSQIAEGYLHYFLKDKAQIYSAGIETHGVNPRAIEIMKEDNIDISNQTSNNVDEYKNIDFDYVITVCDKEAADRCPVFPGMNKVINWSFDDPSQFTGTLEKKVAKTRVVRDQIKEAVQGLIKTISS